MSTYTSINAAQQSKSSCWDGIVSCFGSCCKANEPPIQIDNKTYKIDELIAEGGFSFVYRAHIGSGKKYNNSGYNQFAIKKLHIQTKEQLQSAQWEINVMEELQVMHENHLNIITSNNDNNDIDNKKNNDEQKYETKDDNNTNNNNSNNIKNDISNTLRHINYREDLIDDTNNYILPLLDHIIKPYKNIPEFKIVYMVFPFFERGNLVSVIQNKYNNNIQYLNEKKILIIFIKICYSVYQLHRHQPKWAHRDIKLDNILLDSNDNPYLMDFGSVSEACTKVKTRQEALSMQEWAQSNMTPPYTPPEFFDCASQFTFDERTDVWALGCLLYAMAFGKSPFDTEDTGSCALAVLSGRVYYPENHPYSKQFKTLVDWMLARKLNQRPFVPAIIERVSDVITDLEKEM